MSETTDVIVLGVGTCGEDAALRLLDAGLEVTGIEARLVGGECAYWACLPTKSMVRSANLLEEARRADGLIGKVSVEPDWSVVAARLRAEVTGDWNDAPAAARFEAKGGRLVRGRGEITGPRTVAVGGVEFEARRGIIIATGSIAAIPPIPGLHEVDYWTTREAISAEQLPVSMIVLGGGPVGCELGQVFARFGVDVTIIEGSERLLRSEEPEASAVVMDAFADEGIDVLTGVHATSARSDPSGEISISLDNGGEVRAERLLVATGRRVELAGLGLESAGIDTSGPVIPVDEHLRAGDRIWAIGDVTGKGMLTQVALYQGNIAVADILENETFNSDYTVIPHATFTDPEVGSVGMTEAQAVAAGMDVDVVLKDVQATFRGWLHRTGNKGLIKLVADRKTGILVGASSVGPHGAEVLGMLTVAVRTAAPLDELVNMIYAFPSFFGGVGEALGAYGRGLTRVLDPESTPMFDD